MRGVCPRRAAAALLAATAAAAVAGGATPEQLAQRYGALQNESCSEVLPHIPALPAGDAASFMRAYQNFTGTGDADEAAVIHLADLLLSRSDVQAFLSLPDSFAQPGGLDAAMVRCAVLFEATPSGLAGFAAQGQGEEALVGRMLNDTLLMRDMLLAGGARGGKYGEAMSIYSRLLKASGVLSSGDGEGVAAGGSGATDLWDDRSQNKKAILRRLALGTAVEHAVPLTHRWGGADVDPVARYLHYERAYLAGDLDPAFEVLTAFEYRHVADSDATDDDLLWMRQTMANYRPDDIAKDHPWRYAQAVHSDVAYGHPACDDLPGICTGRYAQIPTAGGECGPRAFFGRVTREAFGLPTWGVTQPGHAAMTTWAPDGWHVLLGSDWKFSWWDHRSPSRGGPDFALETQCRELRPAYQKVLRGGWAAGARGEEAVDPSWTPNGNKGYGKGGLWSALMLYQKKLAVADATKSGAALPTRPVGPSVVPTKVAGLLARWPAKVPPPAVTTGADGTVTIPAAAFTIKNKSASLAVMKSYDDDGEQVLHNKGSLDSPESSAFGYEVTVGEAGAYFLTANITTWHVNQDLVVSANAAKAQVVPVYYTLGYWNETQPVEVTLLKGKNVLTFMRSSDREIAFKAFFLSKKKPVVPPPPSDYTPSPTVPTSAYIEVGAGTTCAKQGIADITSEKDCGRACSLLGLDYTGAKARPNMTGCFTLTSGQWAGDCNYNTNKSASCATPPCTVYDAVAQALCVRK